MSVPLIDDRARAELRRIENAASELLAKANKTIRPHIKTSAGRAQIERDAVALIDDCAKSCVPPPPALVALLAELLVGVDKAGDRRRGKRSIGSQKYERAIQYLAALPDDKRPTVNGMAQAAGVHHATAEKLLRDDELRSMANAERWCRDNPEEIARDKRDDVFGLERRARLREERQLAVSEALGTAPQSTG